jgi:hypothetical protein
METNLSRTGKEIIHLASEFEAQHNLNVQQGNKAAGRRARKATLEIGKLLKEYRKLSMEREKSEGA